MQDPSIQPVQGDVKQKKGDYSVVMLLALIFAPFLVMAFGISGVWFGVAMLVMPEYTTRQKVELNDQYTFRVRVQTFCDPTCGQHFEILKEGQKQEVGSVPFKLHQAQVKWEALKTADGSVLAVVCDQYPNQVIVMIEPRTQIIWSGGQSGVAGPLLRRLQASHPGRDLKLADTYWVESF